MTLLELLLLIRAMDRGEHPGWTYHHLETRTEPHIMVADYHGRLIVLASMADFTRTKSAIQTGVDVERETRTKGE